MNSSWQNPLVPEIPLTIDALLSALAKAIPLKTAIRGEGSALTFLELDRVSREAAAILQEHGATKGRIVAVDLPAGPRLLLAVLAIVRAGAAALPLHGLLRSKEVQTIFNSVLPVAAVGAEYHHLEVPTWSFDEIFRASGPAKITTLSMPDDLALIRITSGTTGSPKIIGLTHGHLCRRIPFPGPHYSQAHVYGCSYQYAFPSYQIVTALAAGGTIAFQPAVTVSQVEQFITTAGITYYWGVPSFYRQIAHRRNHHHHHPGLLQAASSSGSYLEPEIIVAVQEKWGIPVYQYYGQSELGFYTEAGPDTPLGSVGRTVPGAEIRICDDNGKVQKSNGQGTVEVWVEPPFQGYLSGDLHPIRADGWFKTGDIGRLDEDGNLFLEGRESEIIHVAGYKVSPREVAVFIEQIPGVHGVHVFGETHFLRGEIVAAAIVADPGLTDRKIRALCRREFPAHKVPARVYFPEELPFNPLGKVDFPRLLELIHPEKA